MPATWKNNKYRMQRRGLFLLAAAVTASAAANNTFSSFEFIPILTAAFYEAKSYGVQRAEALFAPPYDTYSTQQRVDALLQQLCFESAATSALTGLATAFVPGSQFAAIPIEIRNTLFLEVAMAAGLMTLRGRNLAEPASIVALFTILGGKGLRFIILRASKRVLATGAATMLTKMLVKALVPILGRKVLSMAGTSTAVAMVKVVPFAGALAGFAVDGGMCYAFGKTADVFLQSGKSWKMEEGGQRSY